MNDKIVIKDENGEKEYYKLVQFYSDKTKKRYLIYTDKKFTNGFLNVYSSIIEEENGKVKFKKITEEDKEIVNNVIDNLKKVDE